MKEQFLDSELEVLAQEAKIEEDQAELEQNAANGAFCLKLIGLCFLVAIALVVILKH